MMIKKAVSSPLTGEMVAKRMMYLAWQACGGTQGMGFMRNHPEATEDEVWQNVRTRGDYVRIPGQDKPGEVYADYVFGRMMKMGLTYAADSVSWHDSTPRRDYQAWCGVYRTVEHCCTGDFWNFRLLLGNFLTLSEFCSML